MLKRKIVWPVLILSGIIVAFIFYVMNNMKIYPMHETSSISYPDGCDTTFCGMVWPPGIDDSLPHYQYKRIEDSLKAIYDKQVIVNEGRFMSGSSFGMFGVQTTKGSPYESDKWYISLYGYHLKDPSSDFFINNGTYNLAVVKWLTRTGDHREGIYERKQIPVRFNKSKDTILIPMSRAQYNVLSPIVSLLPLLLIGIFFYFLVGLPAVVLINISKGKAFSEKNIAMLNTSTMAMLVYTLVAIFIPYIIRLAFQSRIPGDFTQVSFADAIFDNLGNIIVCIAFFLITKAFKRGYKLQEDQDLTI